MDNKHLNDFLELSEKYNINIDTIISDYTRQAIIYSINGFSPKKDDYDLAYQTIIEKIEKNTKNKGNKRK